MATQAEIQWTKDFPKDFQEIYGGVLPADGVIGQQVKEWYTNGDGKGRTPNATDAAIIAEVNQGTPGGGVLDPNTGTVTGSGNTLGGLVTPSTTTTTPVAAVTTVPNSNYNQVQNANQSGSFSTVGQTNQVTGQDQTSTQNSTQKQNTTQNTNQNTTNSQLNEQRGTSNQNTEQVQNTTGSQNTSGTQNQVTTGSETDRNATQQNTTGTTTNQGTTNVIDSLGFGQLLKDAATTTNQNDASRSSFLKDTMETGGSQFGSQVDQAIRGSLSGPGMAGTGDSARARASGYAAAQIGRNNMGQRLEAAQQLAGPTGLTTLASAGNPYLGQSTSNTGTASTNVTGLSDSTRNTLSSLLGNSTQNSLSNQSQNSFGSTSGSNTSTGTQSGTQNTTGSQTGSQDTVGSQSGTQGTKGFSNMLEASTGSTAAGSSQAASGQVPQGQPVKSGGCVVCTAGLELGLFRTPRALRKAALHKVEVETGKYRSALGGYFKVFTPLARWMLRHPKLSTVGMPIAKAVVYEELRIAGQSLPFRFWPWFHHTGWHFTCKFLSLFASQDHVSDETILGIAKKYNVCFNIKERV